MNFSKQIYDILVIETDALSTKELARRLGLTSDRRLRANGSDMGESERAKAYAFRVHRRLIMTTHQGIQIVEDPEVADRMMSKRFKHWTQEQRAMNKDKIRIGHLRESVQTTLFSDVPPQATS